MLPTPSTSHLSFDSIYEPAEDSYLFLDTLSDSEEISWLSSRFNKTRSSPPIILEVGTGSGVVLSFLAANSKHILGRSDILTLGTDVNEIACTATRKTVEIAIKEDRAVENSGDIERDAADARAILHPLAVITADLCSPFRAGTVDILLFNPPYVPTSELPHLPEPTDVSSASQSKFERESYLLSLSYAGGELGMETTNRLLASIPSILSRDRGVAYVLLCAQNKPQDVMQQIKNWGTGWSVEIAGRSGVKAGWERLIIIRIWRE
ncbi:S-adenosylmethionine-dependent methyltransferase [Myotisia sp. PD_48]|nr:S-adenosylmethionine-dependent methyltransferase [Myotisia sp. PD_48]